MVCNSCKATFCNSYKYCPYCGTVSNYKIYNQGQTNNYNDNFKNIIVNNQTMHSSDYKYQKEIAENKAQKSMTNSVLCMLFTLLPFAIIAIVYSMKATDYIKLNNFKKAYKCCNISKVWNIIAIILSICIVVTAILFTS